MSVALLVIAKAPVPGRAKTRLCPPCTPAEAARLAEAALADTLVAVRATPARRRTIFLDGEPGPWLPPGFELLPQATGGLGERLAAAFAAVPGPALLVGMDTPQITPALLERSAARLLEPGTDAVLGPALDGGYWAIGFRQHVPGAFDGVPMSSPRTGARQLERLRELGLRVGELPQLRDVDEIGDALQVAAEAPGSRFSAALTAFAAPA